MAYRVIQWTTGNVGRQTLRALIAKPSFELVGVYAHGGEKIGRDAADLCGLSVSTGVIATDDVDALLALRPDACVFSGRWFDVDAVIRLLDAGINVVTHSAFITGRWLGEDVRGRLEDAARRGGASLYGSGINPGFANIMGVVSAQLCMTVDCVTVTESVDATYYDSWETEVMVGYGQAPGAPGQVESARKTTEVFGDAVEMMADALGFDLDEITFDLDTAVAGQDTDLGYAFIPAGTVSAVDGRWRGRIAGEDRIVLRFRWLKGPHVADFPIDHGYRIDVDGNPGVVTTVRLKRPAPKHGDNPMMIGMIATGLPALNAIPAVCAAAPGIVRMNDIAGFGAVDAAFG